jgi:hypothetical protein
VSAAGRLSTIGAVVLFVVAACSFGTRLAHAQPAAPDQQRKDEARSHFELGLAHFDNQEWGAALAEFLLSRELYPTRAATKDAVICLRKEKRYDEALEMLERLVREFPDMPPTDQAFAQKEGEELRALVGALDVQDAEPGASILVDGRDRGGFPPPGKLVVSVGTHVVRVYKEGFVPFEDRVEIAGRQTALVRAQLRPLTQSGRLRIVEQSSRVLDVVVDDVRVGQTPWEGTLATGVHTVVLRGSSTLGTQPASARVVPQELTTLSLVAEPLEAAARLIPTPADASVSLDGVVVGHGVWEGRLRVGPHRIDVGQEGFIPVTREVVLAAGAREVVAVVLDRDPTSPVWGQTRRPRFTIEVDAAFALAPTLGGDVVGRCTACGLPIGLDGVFRGGYELRSGLGLAVEAGYLRLGGTVSGPAVLLPQPSGNPKNGGTADDALRLEGVLLGASAAYHRGEHVTLLFRLGGGVYLASARDARSATFTNSMGTTYPLPPGFGQSTAATYAYFSPEARVGYRLGEHIEVSVGASAILLFALKQPRWDGSSGAVLTSRGLPDTGDGEAVFAADSLAGTPILVLTPGIGVRYEL